MNRLLFFAAKHRGTRALQRSTFISQKYIVLRHCFSPSEQTHMWGLVPQCCTWGKHSGDVSQQKKVKHNEGQTVRGGFIQSFLILLTLIIRFSTGLEWWRKSFSHAFLMQHVCCSFLTVSLSYLDVGNCTTVELNGTGRNNELQFHMHVNALVISRLLSLTS